MTLARITCVMTAAAALALGGCSVGGPPEDVTVMVRDAQTRAPIAGASVSVEIVEPRNPVSVTGVVRELMGSEPPAGGDGVTNADGTITLPVVTQLPCNVVIAVPGYGVHTFQFSDNPTRVNDGAWIEPPAEHGLFVTRLFQVRFVGAAKPADQ